MSARVVGGPVVVLVAAALLVGCGRQGPEVKSQIEVVQRENTWQKLFERGRAFAQVGDQTRAEQYLSAALDAGGDGRKILPMLMSVCVEAKKYRVAIDYGDEYLKKEPGDVRLRHLLGTLHLVMGETPQAKECFEEVLRRDTAMPETHYALAVLLRDQERNLVGADKHFRDYLRLSPAGAHAPEARASLLKSVP